MFKLPTNKKLGIYLFVLGIIIFLKIILADKLSLVVFTILFLIILAIDLLIQALGPKKKKNYFIPGSILFLSTIFLMIYFLILKKYALDLKILWPVFGGICGISMILFFIFYHSQSPSIIVPGVFILFLSIVFLLANIGVIQINFKKFLLLLIPGFLIIIGIFLIFYEKVQSLKNHLDINHKRNNNHD